jgi:hypothetical protein
MCASAAARITAYRYFDSAFGNDMDALVSRTSVTAMFVVSRNCFVYRRSVRATSFQSTYLRSSPGR